MTMEKIKVDGVWWYARSRTVLRRRLVARALKLLAAAIRA